MRKKCDPIEEAVKFYFTAQTRPEQETEFVPSDELTGYEFRSTVCETGQIAYTEFRLSIKDTKQIDNKTIIYFGGRAILILSRSGWVEYPRAKKFLEKALKAECVDKIDRLGYLSFDFKTIKGKSDYRDQNLSYSVEETRWDKRGVVSGTEIIADGPKIIASLKFSWTII